MRNRRALEVRVLFASILLAVGYFLLIPEGTYYHRSTKDAATKRDPWQGYLQVSGRTKLLSARPQDFVVKGDTIYLLTRRTESLPLFMAVLRHQDKVWSIGELNTLSSNHAELKSLWPDSNAKNLGVQWISIGKM